MRKQVLVLAMVAAGAGAAAAAPAAARAETGRGHGKGDHLAALKEELGLTDAQLEQIRQLRQSQRQAAVEQHHALGRAHRELSELVRAADPDESAIDAKIKEVGRLDTAALKARIDARLAERKVLTPEQQHKLEQLHAARHRQLGKREWRGRPGTGESKGPGQTKE